MLTLVACKTEPLGASSPTGAAPSSATPVVIALDAGIADAVAELVEADAPKGPACGNRTCAPGEYCIVTTAFVPAGHRQSVERACARAAPTREDLRCSAPESNGEIHCVKLVRAP